MPAYSSKTKFNSGTGWPSFYDKLEGVELETGNKWDNLVGMRSEVHCIKCGGHQGHVFGECTPGTLSRKMHIISGNFSGHSLVSGRGVSPSVILFQSGACLVYCGIV